MTLNSVPNAALVTIIFACLPVFPIRAQSTPEQRSKQLNALFANIGRTIFDILLNSPLILATSATTTNGATTPLQGLSIN